MHRTRTGIGLGGLALAAAASVALAQAQGIKRTILQRVDVEGTEHKECVFGLAELAPGAAIGKHFHHGYELGVVAEGEGELLVDGEAPRHVRAGDTWKIDPRRPHDARNTGAVPLKVVATYVVEKGKPLAEPVK
ncbi:MAG TPA: cupin domain-containing protein [Anaeromyxobacteraceae bacterium]|nr:cupin domain-containing protein [Anaeromyxobacteraceae bacterium]